MKNFTFYMIILAFILIILLNFTVLNISKKVKENTNKTKKNKRAIYAMHTDKESQLSTLYEAKI